MGKYRAYPEYRDSGVEWLGEVPKHWSTGRIKYLATGKPDSFTDGDWIESPYIQGNGIRLLQTGNLGVGYFKEQGFRYISEETFHQLRCTEVSPDDVLICRLAAPVGRAILAPDLGVRMVTSVDVCILKPKARYDRRFIVYFLSSAEYLNHLNSSSRGGTRDRVSRSALGDVAFVLPSSDEQAQIAAFLDRETARIDRLIAKQERLIELLKEKRQAVISHAVTKGLDPDAPMKDSGVEWLGEIPAHWGVARLGYYAHVTNGSTPSKAVREYWSDGDIPWASSGDLNQYHIESPSGNITSKALLECSLSIVPAGSVLIGMVGQGKTRGLSALLKVDSTINQNVAAVACDGRLDSIFLHFILQSIYKSLREYGRGGNQAALNCEIVSSIRFPLPDRQEQKNIAQVLELKLGKIAMVMEQAEKQIELLQERRTALISAAVTGKIDVREAV